MVDKRTLEFILTDQQEEMESRTEEALCQRCEESLVDIKSTQAQVVIGVRRSGKSTLCYQALHNHNLKFAYADFDDERLVDLNADQLSDVLEILYKIYGDFQYLFLDEIQNVEGWHLFVNRMLRKKMHVIITGSNAKLLSGELATHLSGRNKEISLYPFSFREFCVIKEVDTDNILKRDIEQRYKIAYKAAFENLAHHLLNVSPAIVVTTDLADLFHFKSEHTAKNYVKYLKEAYLLIGIQKYSQKSKQRSVQEKVYAVDVAMMDQRENAFAGDNLGHRLETIVAIHLIRKCKTEGLDVYYLNDRSGECDFVVCKGNQVIQAIQVSYDISTEKTYKREKNGLLLAARQTKCENLLLLTDHESGDKVEEGYKIKVQPVYEWSLELGL